MLDADGEAAFTFRALTARLATGAGAVYWHVADKNALLVAATDEVVDRVVDAASHVDDPRTAVREFALGLFDAIRAHPWVGSQLSREPWQAASLQIFDRFGRQLQGLGVPEEAQFDCASALLSYVQGLAGQYAAAARLLASTADDAEFEAATDRRLDHLDPERFPFVHRMAAQLRDHDDRPQFLAGIDVILAGIGTLR